MYNFGVTLRQANAEQWVVKVATIKSVLQKLQKEAAPEVQDEAQGVQDEAPEAEEEASEVQFEEEEEFDSIHVGDDFPEPDAGAVA